MKEETVWDERISRMLQETCGLSTEQVKEWWGRQSETDKLALELREHYNDVTNHKEYAIGKSERDGKDK